MFCLEKSGVFLFSGVGGWNGPALTGLFRRRRNGPKRAFYRPAFGLLRRERLLLCVMFEIAVLWPIKCGNGREYWVDSEIFMRNGLVVVFNLFTFAA